MTLLSIKMKRVGILLTICGILGAAAVLWIFSKPSVLRAMDIRPEIAITCAVLLVACGFIIWVGGTMIRESKEP